MSKKKIASCCTFQVITTSTRHGCSGWYVFFFHITSPLTNFLEPIYNNVDTSLPRHSRHVLAHFHQKRDSTVTTTRQHASTHVPTHLLPQRRVNTRISPRRRTKAVQQEPQARVEPRVHFFLHFLLLLMIISPHTVITTNIS